MRRSAWARELWWVVALLTVAGLLGWTAGHPVSFMMAVLLVYLGWHLVQLRRLERWLESPKLRDIPEGAGVWRVAYERLYLLHKQNRKRKARLSAIIKRFKQASKATPDGAVIMHGDGRIQWMNEAAQDLLGLRYPRDVGQPVANLVRDPEFTDYLASDDLDEPRRVRSPSRPDHVLSVHLVPYAKRKTLLLVRDVTRLHRLEQMRRQFVANVSHELRTPLTVIRGYLESLSDADDLPGDWEQPLLRMDQQSSRMCRIVEDLLELSRLESDPHGAPRTVVCVKDMLENIRGDALGLSDGKHTVTLTSETEHGLLGEYNELYSAFSNLVFNAVRYTPSGGRIGIRWYQDKAGLHLAVSDTGLGIPPEHIAHLTERFYRVDRARSRDLGGTGLGLAIVKHVLVRHDAQLRIESVEGEGSTFSCDFPTARVAPTLREVAG